MCVRTRTMTRVCLFTGQSSQGVLDLTELIGIPLPPSVSFVTGYEGYPAYSFGPDNTVGRLATSHVPNPFYYDFAVSVTIKPTTQRGGVLFAITDRFQKVGGEAGELWCGAAAPLSASA